MKLTTLFQSAILLLLSRSHVASAITLDLTSPGRLDLPEQLGSCYVGLMAP
jgi:hypothetical protein